MILERERWRETLICCSTHLYIHWLILVYFLSGDQACNFGVLGQCSIQLNYLARALQLIFVCSVRSRLSIIFFACGYPFGLSSLLKTIFFPIDMSWYPCWKSVDHKCRHLFFSFSKRSEIFELFLPRKIRWCYRE